MLVDAWLDRAARERPDHPAVNAMTYAQLDAAATGAARHMYARGVRAEMHVGLALPPGEEFAVALHATWRLGGVAVPIDLRLTPQERPRCDVMIEGAAGAGPQAQAAPLVTRFELDAPAAIIYTSGTTGAPKPVTITFGNWLWAAIGSAVAIGHTPGERWLSALPLSHVGGLSILIRSAIAQTTAVVHDSWDTERVVEALMEEDITLVSLVTTMLTRLLDAGLRHPPALRCVLAGGGPIAPALVRRARVAGVPIVQTFGMTETTAQVTTQTPGDVEEDAGPPLFFATVRIGPDSEVLVSGPTVTLDGELATGDLGSLDRDGRLTVIGRKADTIISGGENVAPQEVEAVLIEHPSVAEAAVFGRPHPAWGEAVVAAIVLRAGSHVSEPELRAHCAARLAGFKVPKEFSFVPVLPRTRSGKLRRASLQ